MLLPVAWPAFARLSDYFIWLNMLQERELTNRALEHPFLIYCRGLSFLHAFSAHCSSGFKDSSTCSAAEVHALSSIGLNERSGCSMIIVLEA